MARRPKGKYRAYVNKASSITCRMSCFWLLNDNFSYMYVKKKYILNRLKRLFHLPVCLFYLFYFIILPHTMNYKQNKNDNK